MTAPVPDDPSARPHTPGASAQPGVWEPAGFAPPPGYPVPPYPAPRHPAPPAGYGVRPGYGMPAVSPAGAPLASFGDRLLAHLIDMALFLGIGFVLALPFVVILFSVLEEELSTSGEPPDPWAIILPMLALEAGLVAALLVVSYLYHVELMVRRRGQTLGKKVMKLWVTPLAPGETLNRGHCLRRWLVQFGAGSFVPFFSYLDGLWQLGDKPYQQCLHDKWGRTVVVKAP